MPTSDDERERHRWELLRWGPRDDSGVLYHPLSTSEVWLDTLVEAVPFLVSTGDFAPADMQYRMHREHLWDPATGLYGERYDLATATWVRKAPTASGNAAVALAMAHALRVGGDGTPAEMRGRWQRETRDLILAVTAIPATGEAAATLARAASIGAADGWG